MSRGLEHRHGFMPARTIRVGAAAVCYGGLVLLVLTLPTTARAQSFMSIGSEEGVREVAPDLDDSDADSEDPVAKPTAGVGSVNYEQHAASGTREGSQHGMVAMDQLSVSTGFPIFFDGPRTMLAVGLMYGRTNFEYTGGTEVGADVLHTFKTTLTFRHELAERWTLLLRYVPNLNTNMNDVTMGHVTHGAQVITTYSLGPNETLYLGLAFSQQLPMYVLPGAGYELFSGRWHVEIRAPEKVELGYMLTPRVEVGATARYQNTLFGIGGVSQLDRISYTTAWAGATLDVRVFAGLHVRAALGRTVVRRFRGRDDGEETRAIALEQTMVGRVAVAYEVDR
ncbi:MAG: DUF6268 family outer membrane beta-barrel protein [Myxococcota bacterium]